MESWWNKPKAKMPSKLQNIDYWYEEGLGHRIDKEVKDDMLRKYLLKLDQDQLEIRRNYLTDPDSIPAGTVLKDRVLTEAEMLKEEHEQFLMEQEALENGENGGINGQQAIESSYHRVYQKAETPELEQEEQDKELARNIDEVIPYGKLEHLKSRQDVLDDIFSHTEKKLVDNQEKLIELQKSNIDAKMLENKHMEGRIEQITDLDFKFPLNYLPGTL